MGGKGSKVEEFFEGGEREGEEGVWEGGGAEVGRRVRAGERERKRK